MGRLRRETWRWFTVRLGALTDDSAWMCALYPTDPSTGDRTRAGAAERRTVTITEPSQVDAFIAQQGRA